MQQFIIDVDSYRNIRKGIWISNASIIAITIIGMVAFGFGSGNGTSSLFNCIILAVMGVSMYRIMKRHGVLFESFTLTINDDELITKRVDMPAIVMRRDDVKEVILRGDGSFMVKGKNAKADIYIPAQVNNYEQLEDVLDSIEPITVVEMTLSDMISKYIAAILAVVGLTICVFMTGNKILVGTCGFLLLLVMSVGFFKIQLNRNLDTSTKRYSYFIPMVLAAVVVVVCFKLFV